MALIGSVGHTTGSVESSTSLANEITRYCYVKRYWLLSRSFIFYETGRVQNTEDYTNVNFAAVSNTSIKNNQEADLTPILIFRQLKLNLD